MIHFILGGARSGKSRYAENLAKQYEAQGKQVCYFATAQIHDAEMQQRVTRHQTERPDHWQTLETDVDLADQLSAKLSDNTVLLVDCLTLWTLNCLEKDQFESEKQRLQTLLASVTDTCPVILVSNEIGLGVVPMGEITRQFVDELGWLHQDIATLADEVVLMVAGLPSVLKPA